MQVPRPVDPDRIRAEDNMGKVLGSFVHNTAEVVARSVREYVGAAPVEEIFIWASISGMPEQMVADHIRRIATQLKPLLA